MAKRIKNLQKIWWVALLEVLLITLVFYLILGQTFRKSIEAEIYDQEFTLARAEANNIKSFIDVVGNSISSLAQSPEVQSESTLSEFEMKTFVDKWQKSGVLGGVVLVDRNGVVKYNENVEGTHAVGSTLADRDYFIWAKNQQKAGNYFVGNPVVSRLGASQGETIVPLAAPIIINGSFKGAIVTSVVLSSLTEQYLNTMKVNNSTSIHLVDEKGNVLYEKNHSPITDVVSGSVQLGREGKLKTNGQLIVYTPVSLGAQNWLLVVNTPEGQIVTNTMSFHIRQILVIMIMGGIAIVSAILVYKKSRKK